MNHVDSSRNTPEGRRGFTLVELMLAMSFISVLLIAIAMTIIQVSTIYTKGMTLKEVNQTGRDISTDVIRAVAASGKTDLASDFVEVTSGSTLVGGRLCLGSSSYIWNYAAAIEAGNTRLTKYTPDDGTTIRLVRVPDGSRAYCAKGSDGQLLAPNILPADAATARELLREGDRTLALHRFSIAANPAAYDQLTGQHLYRISLTIGTQRTDLLAAPASPADPLTCRTPAELGSDFNYCTVQDFSLVVRTGGGV